MSRIRLSHAFATLAAALLTATPAAAQIGGIIKKGAEKAVSKAVEQQAQPSNLKPSDAFGAPLTESSLKDVLRGFAAELAKVDKRDALEKQADSVSQKRSNLLDKHQTESEVYDKQSNAHRECQSNVQNKLREKHNADAQGKAMDPTLQAKMMLVARDYSMAVGKAQQSGDTAALAKAQADYQTAMMKAMGVDLHADSMAVEKECGKQPAEPAWMAEAKALETQENDLRTKMRMADADIISSGAAASGMPLERYGQARERVVNWFHEVSGGMPMQEFPAAERRLLESRKGEISRFKKVLT